MIYIIIPVHNRYKYTFDCIKSFRAQTYSDYKIIIADDGSTDETATKLQSDFPDITILKGDGNLWWTGSMNLAVKHVLQISKSDDDYILTINNDLIVKEDYLEQLLSISKKYSKVAVGSVTVDIKDNAIVHHAGVNWNPYTAKFKDNIREKILLTQLQKDTDAMETSLLSGRGVIFPIKLFKEIGLYDEKNFPHYTADYDFAIRAKNAGYKLLVSTGAVVYSYVNETGMKTEKKASFFKYVKQAMTSIKSPISFHNRWRWAKKHAKSFFLFYFIIDEARVFSSLIKSWNKPANHPG